MKTRFEIRLCLTLDSDMSVVPDAGDVTRQRDHLDLTLKRWIRGQLAGNVYGDLEIIEISKLR